ncbi:HTH-type transcriptional regulator glxA [Pseudomonas syringae pv. pisi]|nr:HTH-type transcriptional regulator glxA [Pseudomonas syringae pv. pisi]
MLAEQSGKEAGVVVAHFVADGLDALARPRQQSLCRFDPQPLQVMQRLVACGGLKAAHEIANAHAVLTGHVFKAELVGKVLFQPVLDLQNDHVLMKLLTAKTDSPRRVGATHFIEDVAGDGLGDIGAAEALDQINVQIAGRGRAARAIHVVGVGQVLFLIEQDLGIALGECAEKAPVGRRFLAVQQAGFGKPVDAGGFGAEYRAVGVLFAQPRQDLWVTLAEDFKIVPEGRDDDDVALAERALDRQGDVAEAADRKPVRADQARFEGGYQAIAQLLAVAQARQVEEILGLHDSGGKHLVRGQDAYAAQKSGVLDRHNRYSYMGKWSSNGWIVLFFARTVQPRYVGLLGRAPMMALC